MPIYVDLDSADTWAHAQLFLLEQPGKPLLVAGTPPCLLYTSRKIYAGADLFLMPSKSEPCGLAQMIACRYGTVPVVRATGGLRDSIIDYAQQGFGFRFGAYTTEALLQALYRALEVYQEDVYKRQV